MCRLCRARHKRHTVETHVSSLRKKLGPRLAARLVSVTGHGYKFE
ncbi:MAG: helix-turn-helix domain-containing protein [Elusimicrobia bacterium]|nr:helix-turn-helix domain-containing protein [Elusimicrobiota bacterium]